MKLGALARFVVWVILRIRRHHRLLLTLTLVGTLGAAGVVGTSRVVGTLDRIRQGQTQLRKIIDHPQIRDIVREVVKPVTTTYTIEKPTYIHHTTVKPVPGPTTVVTVQPSPQPTPSASPRPVYCQVIAC